MTFLPPPPGPQHIWCLVVVVGVCLGENKSKICFLPRVEEG